MRRFALLLALGLVFGAVLLGAGFVWSGTGAAQGVERVRLPGGLLTDTPTAILSQTATPAGGTATPTPTVGSSETLTPVGGTATPTPTTPPTVAATPTECLIYFVDVPPDNTFYSYVRCLSCRGIVGGYPCGGPGEPCPGAYYRPGNNVTRGQTAKIVTLAAGFADVVPSSQQTFEDVLPGSTFWLYVEQLAGRGIIGGYPCGGPFEPCVGPGNRPYFRPNNNVTRGQLSKIVAGAAGYAETPTGQTFEDVPPGSTFYLWVERLAGRGTVGGYLCGGVGEPCVPPSNRPYFRPNNNATRGQMSKIAASTFSSGWNIVPGASVGAGESALLGVAAVSASDVWAVGTANNGTLIERWNGMSWSVVSNPNIGSGYNILYNVTVVSASDVWAVGYSNNGSADQTLILHWNGIGWSVIPSPNVGVESNDLWGVVAVGSGDIWAVGFYGVTHQTLIEHWNGASWTVVPSPNLGTGYNSLFGVAAVSATDIRAVGSYDTGSHIQTLTLHWDGVSWTVVPSPNVTAEGNFLSGVAVVSASDIWTVGGYGRSIVHALVEHWDGVSWSVASGPNLGEAFSFFQSVEVVSADDVWAVGVQRVNNPDEPLMAHWNGTRWSVISSPSIGTELNDVYGVAALGASDVWAVGYHYDNTPYQTLVEHYAPVCP